MPSGSKKLLTVNAVTTFVFVILLATCLPSAYGAGKTVTANGNARISTAQSKFGGASGQFGGSGSYLSSVDSDDWSFGTGDWTIDFWVRFSTRSVYVALFEQTDGSVGNWFKSDLTAENWLDVYANVGGVLRAYYYGTWAPSANTWYHMAYIRSGSSFKVYVDGTALTLSQHTVIGDLGNIAGGFKIGADTLNSAYHNGWMDEFRISKGVARWTSSFTRPTAAYSLGSGDDDNVVLLMHMDGTDGSTTFTDDHQTGPPPPPPSDFSISASPTSQSVGAGSSTSYTLSLTASSTYGGGTVSLSVTPGLPSGATGTITPNSVSLAASETKTATLSVSTSITTPGGTSSIVVTATDGTKTHTVTVGLTVSAPASYSFNVKASATQIVVTLTYSWSGSGSPPSGSITIAGPGGTPTLGESGAVVYDRTSITVSGSTSTYSIIHRATFTITAPGSAQTWTALISLSGVSNYNVAIEVS